MTQGPRKTAHDCDQKLLALFDACVHGDSDRRRFLERAARFAVGSATAAMLLDERSLRRRMGFAVVQRADAPGLSTADSSACRTPGSARAVREGSARRRRGSG